MSTFWAYFSDTLRWPQIHAPGALQALTRGLGEHMDATRDDVLYLREQFFPAKAEFTLLPAHGDSRGITRHPTESDAQFRARVVHAWRWHMLGGKTLGLPEILEFYGYPVARIENSADTIPTKWAEFQLELREPATQVEQNIILNQMDTLIWLTNEYKPARSRLARIYHAGYDVRPLILDRKYGLDRNFLDGESGIYYPEHDLVVSFGYRVRSQALPVEHEPLVAWLESCSCLVDYLTRPQLDRFRLDVPLLQPPTLNAAHIESAEIEAIDHGHDLSLHPAVARAVSKSQLDLDWSGLDGVNARLDRPHVVRVENPCLFDAYRLDSDIQRRVIPIHELFHSRVCHTALARTATTALMRDLELVGGEVFFELHNPRHRVPQLDSLLLDSPRRERFELSEGCSEALYTPPVRRWFDTATPRQVARSQFAIDFCCLDGDARFDGPQVVSIAHPLLLDSYRLDDSIGLITQHVPMPALWLTLGVGTREQTTPLCAETVYMSAAVAVAVENRQPQQGVFENTFAAPANLLRQTRSGVARFDMGKGLDAAYLHGRPFDAVPSQAGAEALPMLAVRAKADDPIFAAADHVYLGDTERVPPCLWASGWTARPWTKHFAYLKGLSDELM